MSSRFNSNLNTLLTEGLDWYIQERDSKNKTGTEAFLASIHSGSHGRSDNSKTIQKPHFAQGMLEQQRCSNTSDPCQANTLILITNIIPLTT